MISFHADILCDGVNCFARIGVTDADSAQEVVAALERRGRTAGWRKTEQGTTLCPKCVDKRLRSEIGIRMSKETLL